MFIEMSAFLLPGAIIGHPSRKACSGRGIKIQQPTDGTGYALPLVIYTSLPDGSLRLLPEVPTGIHSRGCFFVWFPSTGNRNNSSGALTNVGSNGNYWSDTPQSAANGYNLNFNAGTVTPSNNNNRANGFAARCVSEL
jgi:hypothetical protein